MENPDPDALEAWFAAHRDVIEALIDESCAAAERGELIDGDDAHSRLNEMRRAKFPRYFIPLR
jgi:hypothetical protein